MSLAHCPLCDLWLRPDEACLHIPAHRASAPDAGRCDPVEGGADTKNAILRAKLTVVGGRAA